MPFFDHFGGHFYHAGAVVDMLRQRGIAGTAAAARRPQLHRQAGHSRCRRALSSCREFSRILHRLVPALHFIAYRPTPRCTRDLRRLRPRWWEWLLEKPVGRTRVLVRASRFDAPRSCPTSRLDHAGRGIDCRGLVAYSRSWRYRCAEQQSSFATVSSRRCFCELDRPMLIAAQNQAMAAAAPRRGQGLALRRHARVAESEAAAKLRNRIRRLSPGVLFNLLNIQAKKAASSELVRFVWKRANTSTLENCLRRRAECGDLLAFDSRASPSQNRLARAGLSVAPSRSARGCAWRRDGLS